MEIFDCSGPGPAAHTGGEGGEVIGEHGSGGEGGSESAGTGGEEGSGANALPLDETFDSVRSGARLILKYDAASNSFNGTVENTTNNVLTGSGSKCTFRTERSSVRRLRRTWLQARWRRSTYLRRRHRSPDGRHTPRLAPEAREASQAGSIGLVMSTAAARNPAANTIAVARGGEAARANRSRPGGNVEVPSGII